MITVCVCACRQRSRVSVHAGAWEQFVSEDMDKVWKRQEDAASNILVEESRRSSLTIHRLFAEVYRRPSRMNPLMGGDTNIRLAERHSLEGSSPQQTQPHYEVVEVPWLSLNCSEVHLSNQTVWSGSSTL